MSPPRLNPIHPKFTKPNPLPPSHSVGGFDYQPDDDIPDNPLTSSKPPPPNPLDDPTSPDSLTPDPARLLSPRLGGTNLYLIGLMGSGKSAIAQTLALRMGSYTFIDTDQVITNLLPDDKSIAEFFEEEGEEEFRKIETQVLAGVHGYVRCVVSTGGGIVCAPQNWSKLQTGIVVFLDPDLDVIASRLENDTTRPLLAGSTPIREKLSSIMSTRRKMYEQADVTVKIGGEGVEQVVDMVVRECHKFIDENPPKQYQQPEEGGESKESKE
ncbi:hypothetical protein TrLO_g8300 [Triparma laevis f. longispina]|uniref:shikimate kinase n=1 Tax=Triparma laevis f. longispina TaxID=1714387 RepID=A0A9W7E1E4_9STRA|nr:hypothetical protein TrLO_g8300 [Triparma laevis f. longispina]